MDSELKQGSLLESGNSNKVLVVFNKRKIRKITYPFLNKQLMSLLESGNSNKILVVFNKK